MRILTVIIIALMFSACSKKAQPTRLKIELPALSVQFKSNPTVQAANSGDDSPWFGSITSASEINCYGIFIGGSEPELKKNYCNERSTNNRLIDFGEYVGGVPAGSAIEIELESDVEREITLIAMQAQNGACKDFHNDGPEENQLTHPRVVYQQKHTFSSGQQAIAIAIASDLSTLKEIDECDIADDNQGNNPPGPQPLTPVAAYDISGLAAGIDSIGEFGHALASAQDVLVVGVPRDISYSGSVYAYRWDGTQWLSSRLTLPALIGAAEFGFDVDTDGEQIIVGAPSNDGGRGAAFVYHWDPLAQNWGSPISIGVGANAGDNFGSSVAIENDLLAIGAPMVDPGSGNPNGAVYTYKYDGANWGTPLQLNYTSSTPAVFDNPANDLHFGFSLAIDGYTLAVGAPQFEAPGHSTDAGAVYIYQYDNSYTQIGDAQVVLPDLAINTDVDSDTVQDQTIELGKVIDLSHSTLVAGNPDFNLLSLSSYEGLVLVSKAAVNDWTVNSANILGSWVSAANSNAGASVAVNGDKVIFGNPQDSMAGPCGFVEYHYYDTNTGGWTMHSSLTNPLCGSTGADDHYGSSVTLTDQFSAIGAKSRDFSGTSYGGVTIIPEF